MHMRWRERRSHNRFSWALFRLLTIICLIGWATVSQGSTFAGKGVNYETGNGMNQLNCDSGNVKQIQADMKELAALHLQWVRVEVSMSSPSTLSCPKLPPFQGLKNMLAGIRSTGAKPLVDILASEYSSGSRGSYVAWLNTLLDQTPAVFDFEVGNEENLSYSTEGYKGAPQGDYPYGWEFNASDFAPNDLIGKCPAPNSAKNADLERAVSSYVAWLTDTYTTIKRKRPAARVVIGGLSSYQPECWLEKMGQHQIYEHADAIAYHTYGNNPANSVATLNYAQAGMKSWKKKLPVWITEFGFSTAAGTSGSVPTEQQKAAYMTEEFNLLATKVPGPVIYYTARDFPLTTSQWKQQCSFSSGSCVSDRGHSKPGYIPGTNYDVSGAGLFEWLDGKVVQEPAYRNFSTLRGR
jgi:hypothetical protein